MACGTRYGYKELQNLIRQVGFPENKVVIMSAIFMAESSGCTDIIGTIAKGREYSVGLAQINTLVHRNYSIEQLKNPIINLTEALRIYKSQGLNAWGAYYDKRYLSYLPDAQKVYSGASNLPNLPLPQTQFELLPILPSPYQTKNTQPETKDNSLLYILGGLALAAFLL